MAQAPQGPARAPPPSPLPPHKPASPPQAPPKPARAPQAPPKPATAPQAQSKPATAPKALPTPGKGPPQVSKAQQSDNNNQRQAKATYKPTPPNKSKLKKKNAQNSQTGETAGNRALRLQREAHKKQPDATAGSSSAWASDSDSTYSKSSVRTRASWSMELHGASWSKTDKPNANLGVWLLPPRSYTDKPHANSGMWLLCPQSITNKPNANWGV